MPLRAAVPLAAGEADVSASTVWTWWQGAERSDAGGGQAAALNTIRHIVARHAVEPDPDYVERMTARLAEDAAGALAGMEGELRAAFDAATDLRDLADRLARLDLSPDALTEAMTRAMALAHLAGEAALLDEIDRE